ncbi:MAG: hypothetical protein IAC51_04050 [bacterium]|uniref:Uncharacterized protein n=1 Tax=Candidatus Aphodosoma intestinipullorum TaxID=2840674 RepID=A0A940DIZ9_9BACT|nr:hypothetical protein [Candidatus Aphodosoma intestinipullorum]
MPVINFETFKEQVSILPKEIFSIKGKRYQLIIIEDSQLHFLRIDRRKQENVSKVEKLDLHKLHKFYEQASRYTTTEAKEKKYGLGGKQSPAVAVILALSKNK